MKGFIEVTNLKQDIRQLVNLINVESFSELNDNTLIHFDLRNTITVKESYEQIKELIKQAQ